jgi:hypothetical protein
MGGMKGRIWLAGLSVNLNRLAWGLGMLRDDATALFYSRLNTNVSGWLSSGYLHSLFFWCREGGSNPHDPKIGGF